MGSDAMISFLYKGYFTKDICRMSADPSASAPVDARVAIPAFSPDPDDDLTTAAFPILPDAVVAGDIEHTVDVPVSVTEIDIIRRLVAVDFNHDSWKDYESTHWQQFPAHYIVYKANSVINIPSVNGSPVPHTHV